MTNREDAEGQALLQLALDCGAAKAARITQAQIVYSEAFHKICESNQCGNYGKSWTCPPDSGDYRELMARAQSYPEGVLYQSIHQIEDSFDIEGMEEAAKQHGALSQRIHSALKAGQHRGVFHLSVGHCALCSRCAKLDDQPCRFPDKALLPLEACCIDVYSTTQPTPLRYINGQNTVTYFGLLLFGGAPAGEAPQ